ncbi:E3 ubiquitin-protein ligase RNF185 [Drosophila eugracilis]|uniref:E3 ubiquitin-protein ligase RNF185 n=1 Tax=Drosophila eugracilis TaxID=29029 RepID=UPI0007E7B9F8|nr:E3 ubiquitin-protein ligase RNF185 [Drosophila eugracilis]
MSDEFFSKGIGQLGTVMPTESAAESAGVNTPHSSMGDNRDISDLKPETGTETGSSSKSKDIDASIDGSLYDCNICLDTAQNAVVSMCGHLFCWPCLHRWLITRPNPKLCPVCKSSVDRDKVIPVYGRNNTRQEDPRDITPPRPTGHRTEPDADVHPIFRLHRGFHMTFGIGAPFGFISSTLNLGEPRNVVPNRNIAQFQNEETMSKFFLYMAFVFIGWLLFT